MTGRLLGFCFLFGLFSLTASAQPPVNTPIELEVIRLINFMRTDPRGFSREILEPYHISYPTTQSYMMGVRLSKMEAVKPFEVKTGLNKSAEARALVWKTAGDSGRKANTESYDRIHRQYPGAVNYATTQITGYNSPQSVVVGMLLGDLTQDSLPGYLPALDPKLASLGISIMPYKPDCAIVVIDYADYRPEGPPSVTVPPKTRPRKSLSDEDCPPGSKVVKRRLGKPKTLR